MKRIVSVLTIPMAISFSAACSGAEEAAGASTPAAAARYTFGSLGGKRQMAQDAARLYYLAPASDKDPLVPGGELRIIEKPSSIPQGGMPPPAPIGTLKLDGIPEGLEWIDPRTLCVTTGHALVFVDVSSPAKPAAVAHLAVARREFEGVSEAKKAGDFLYLAARRQGLLRVDVTDPRQPRLAGALPLPGFASSIDVKGDMLAVATGTGIAFVADPAGAMSVASFADTLRDAEIVRVLGDRLVLASKEYVVAYDVSDIRKPVELAELPLRDPFFFSYIVALHLTAKHLFAAGGEGGLYVWEWSQPRDARLVVQYSFWGNDHRVTREGKIRYARSVGLSGSDEELLAALPATENLSIVAAGMAVDGSRIYMSDYKGKLWALEVRLDGAPAAHPVIIPCP